ncbi:hypothetical protein BD408DRAFT_482700 [Parasitella parasitica]|nr:hypothetical protein BD408DRAFT_482700 [Parasitella parasitica]
MDFQMHLCFLGLADNKLYYTKKLKTLTLPTTINNIYPSLRNLVEGLFELLEMCLFMKTSATKGMKRKSMDLVLGDHSEQDAPVCISKVTWDKDDNIEDTECYDIDDSEADITEELENSGEVDEAETNDI